jgi:hypothetical protein
MSPEERHELTDALTREINALSLSMREDLGAADKGIAAVGALILAGLGIALTQKAVIVLVALPYGLGIVFFITLQKYAERLSSAGIKWYLERVLQEITNHRSPVMQEHVADYWRHRRLDETAGYIIYGLVALLALGASLYTANQQTKLSSAVPGAHWLSTRHHIWFTHFLGFAYVDAIGLLVLVAVLYFPYHSLSHAYEISRQRAGSQNINRP